MRYLKLFITGALLVIIISCTINDLSVPAWDTNWKIFLNTDQLTMSEVLTESSLKDSLDKQLGDTLIYISISDSTEPNKIEKEDLAFKPEDDRVVKRVGDVDLDDPKPQVTKSKKLQNLIPVQLGQPVVIPDTTIVPDTSGVEFDSYKSATINTGSMFLVFHNNLTITIDSGMVITVYDSTNTQDRWIGDFQFNDVIEPGDSLQSDPLVDFTPNQRITNSFVLEYSIPIKGEDTLRTVSQRDFDSHFETDVHIINLKVKQAWAKVPVQDIPKENGASALEQSDKEIISSDINSGLVHLKVTNNIEISADVKVTIKSIVDKNKNYLTQSTFVPKDSTSNVTIDLSGYTITNSKNPGAPLDSIRYEVSATSIPSDGLVKITSKDSIVVDVKMDSIYASDFNGTINNKKITIDPIEKDDLIDFSKVNGSFRLPDLSLTFTFYNEINFDIDLHLKLIGEKEENGIVTESKTITVDTLLNRGMSDFPAKTIKVLNANSKDPTIVDLMAIFPTKIRVEGYGIINGTGNVKLGDEIRAEYAIESPLKVLIQAPLTVDMGLDSLAANDLSESDRKKITNDLNDVFINFEISNGTPLGVDFQYAFALDSTNMFAEQIADSSERSIFQLNINPGTTGANGLVVKPGLALTNQLQFTQTQLQIFSKTDNSGNYLPIYFRARAIVQKTNEAVAFRKSDALEYSGNIEVKYKVDVNE